MMRILIVHNHYQQSGGEDAVVDAETALLKKFGNEVRLYERTNSELMKYSLLQKLNFVLNVAWSKDSYQQMKRIIREFHPDVVHFHNIFFMLSPSVYWACREENVPVVHSQHNFRLVCANGLFFRNNHVCEDCLEKSLWHGVIHRCYKNSRFITAMVAWLLNGHWKKGTWKKMVDYYITATEFSRQKLIQAGLAASKILVKPNFVDMYPMDRATIQNYALYVGRLSPEKGVDVLVQAWSTLTAIPLKIMGSGPMEESLKDFVAVHNLKHVEFLGYLSEQQYKEYMKGAQFIVLPSLCYENFPRIVAEAYAYGIPILASRLGTMPDLIKENETGLLFDAGNTEDLASKARWLTDHTQEAALMGERARREYEEKYSAEKNYEFLINIYRQAISGRAKELNPQKRDSSSRPKASGLRMTAGLNNTPIFQGMKTGTKFSIGLKKYAKNTGYLLFEKITRMIFMVTVWAYVARYLGPEQFGLFNYGLSFVFLFSILADLGLEPIVVKELVQDDGRGLREDAIMGSAFTLRFMGAVLAVFLVVAITGIVSMDWTTRVIIVVMSLRLIFSSFRVIDFYFQSKVLSKYTVYSLLFSLLVITLLSLVFIRLQLSLIFFVWAVIFEAIVTAIGLVFFYRWNHHKISVWKTDRQEMLRILQGSWPLMVSGAAVAIYMRIDQIMIKAMLDVASVGYYSSAVRISEAFYFIPMVLTSSLFPAIVNAKLTDDKLYQARIKKLFALLVGIAVSIAVLVSFVAKPVILILYGSRYTPAINVLSIHIWASIFVFLGVGVSKWMISENLQIYYMINTLLGAVTNIILNLFLIPRYGILGTAMATVMSQFVVSTLSNLLNKKTRAMFFLQMNMFRMH